MTRAASRVTKLPKTTTTGQPSLRDAARGIPAMLTSTSTPAGIARFDPDAIHEVDQVDAPAERSDDRYEDVPLARIVASPDNPRQVFDPVALQDLADSLLSPTGLLNPLLVRPTPGYQSPEKQTYELVDGERRYRAAKLAKLKTVRCVIRSLTQSEVAIARLESFRRQGLNALEEARAYQRACQPIAEGGAGLKQTDLAARLKLSQSHIANRLRLLQLPEAWQQMIISGEISEGRTRDLQKFAHRPAILDAALAGLQEWKQYARPNEKLGHNEWEDIVETAVFRHSRRMVGRNFAAKKSITEQLDVIEVAGTEYALNVELWIELETKACAAKSKRAAKDQAADVEDEAEDEAEADDESARPPTREEAKYMSEQKAAAWNRKLYGWYIRWLQGEIVKRIGGIDEPLLWRLVLHFATCSEHAGKRADDLRDELQVLSVRMGDITYHHSRQPVVLQAIEKCPDMPKLLRLCLKRWLLHEAGGWRTDCHPSEIEEIARQMGITADGCWLLTREYLELHTKDQLLDLSDELKSRLAPGRMNGKRSELIDAILDSEHTQHAAVPREIAKIKPVALK